MVFIPIKGRLRKGGDVMNGEGIVMLGMLPYFDEPTQLILPRDGVWQTSALAQIDEAMSLCNFVGAKL